MDPNVWLTNFIKDRHLEETQLCTPDDLLLLAGRLHDDAPFGKEISKRLAAIIFNFLNEYCPGKCKYLNSDYNWKDVDI